MSAYIRICILILALLLVQCTRHAGNMSDHYASEIESLKELGRNSKNPILIESVRFTIDNLSNKRSASGRLNINDLEHFFDSIEAIHGDNPYMNITLATPDDSLDRRGAEQFVVDTDTLNARALWENIVLAHKTWSNTPWAIKYDKEVFYKYILPYRLATEPLDYNWRETAYQDYKNSIDSTIQEPVEACKYINDKIAFSHYNLLRIADLQTYSTYRASPRGGCEGQALYTAMIMRSLGLPVTIDVVPTWGSVNNGHTINALITPEGRTLGFGEPKDLPDGITLFWKCPKIYRNTFDIQKNSIVYKYRNDEPIPALFCNYDIEDVTCEYNVPVKDIEVAKANTKLNRHLAYLSVPKRDQWEVVAYGNAKRRKCTFQNIGYGFQNGIENDQKGENLGDGIVYLPMQYDYSDNLTPIQSPFIHSNSGIHYLIPDINATQNIVITRKYPRFIRIINFAEKMSQCIFEGANKPDFSDAEILHTIGTTPLSRLQNIEILNKKAYKYVRIRSHLGGLSLSEVSFYNQSKGKLDGKIISHQLLSSDTSLSNILDGNTLTYFNLEGAFYDLWVGLEFSTPQVLDSISFCPRTDDNDICPGNIYELFYWDNEWISLGTQIAQDYQLVYSNVPNNALLLIRNHSCGKEERPFTYEKGKQIWW